MALSIKTSRFNSFQNNFIYDNTLIIPSSTYEDDHPNYGVHHHHLPDALYRKGGTNDDEVEKTIELILNHATHFQTNL